LPVPEHLKKQAVRPLVTRPPLLNENRGKKQSPKCILSTRKNNAAGLAARVIPGASLHELLWELPYCLLGFLVMQERRAAGVKGIGRPEKSEKLWRAWKALRSGQPDKQADHAGGEAGLGDDEEDELRDGLLPWRARAGQDGRQRVAAEPEKDERKP
jgi:hypothetical protein